ncbi:MAG: hypothetical protein SF182_30015 [Deltaproteobacteria bacterium]|nr:hypothetical protein [Deltaproteobacteria bacterium]
MIDPHEIRHRPYRAYRRAALACALLLGLSPAGAANTDPTLALLRASAVRGSGGRATLTLETSVSFDDVVQLALPVEVVVTQGNRVARCGLSGTVSLTVGGVAQAAAPPGVIGVSQHRITLVLPPELGAGEASVQLVGTYSDNTVASNVLRVTL